MTGRRVFKMIRTPMGVIGVFDVVAPDHVAEMKTGPSSDVEDGMPCPQEGCQGALVFSVPDDCSCHASPPCPACTAEPLRCTACDHQIERAP